MSEGPATLALPLSKSGVVRLTPRLRERYLTPDVESAIVQATGHSLNVWIWSDNQNIRIELPLDGWRAERLYTRSIIDWGVNVNRWTTPGKKTDGRHVAWFNDASLEVGYGSDSAKEMVQAEVYTVEGVRPDYD